MSYLIGVDVSHWRGRIDWATAKPHIRFAILKCTESDWYKDDTYDFNKLGCEINGIPHGVYHFFRSNRDPVAQANLFYTCAVDPSLNFWCVDVESNDGGDIRGNLKKMLDRLEQLTGKPPWIYTAKYFWNDNIGAQAWASRLPLWVANYDVNQPALPNGWSDWGLWQYGDHGAVPGIPGNVDMDYFPKSEIYLPIVFGNGELPEYYCVRTTANSLYVRSSPNGLIKGYVPLGTRFQVIGEVIKNNYKWLQVGDASYIGASWTEVI
jgi:lysozyme